jgi:hypothetical protein
MCGKYLEVLHKNYVQWNLDIYILWINVGLDSMHIFIGPAKTSITALLYFPGIYVCVSYLIPLIICSNRAQICQFLSF